MKNLLITMLVWGWGSMAYGDGTLLQQRQYRHSLLQGTPCTWEALFRQGSVQNEPQGKTRGTVMYVDGKLPRVHARLQSSLWKGKTFHCDGTFTNRWLGFEAISATITLETSWLDGQPCYVMQYPDKAPIFGGVRDELREIAPNVWLGRSYDAKTGTPKNYFLLQSK